VRRTRSTPLIVLAALAAAPAAPAQTTGWGSGLRPVDQFYEDHDLLATSLRQPSADLGGDLGFERLYVSEDDPTLYVRASGALYAVSTQTNYVGYRGRVYPAIAPGTVFYIGAPPASPASTRPMMTNPNSLGRPVATPVRSGAERIVATRAARSGETDGPTPIERRAMAAAETRATLSPGAPSTGEPSCRRSGRK